MEILKLGRRKMDVLIMVNWRRTRGIVITDVNLVEGICLEPELFVGQKYGAVLIHRDWKNLYFIGERHDWSEDQYFEHAQKLFKEKGIENP